MEVLFSAGMLAGSGILAATGGFRNRSLTIVAAIAGFGVVAIASGLLGPSLFAAFLPASFLMAHAPRCTREPDCPYAGADTS